MFFYLYIGGVMRYLAIITIGWLLCLNIGITNVLPTKHHYNIEDFNTSNYLKSTVDPCDLSGERAANTIVDIGYGSRKYYALTNKNQQITHVYASKLSLQTSAELNDQDRYCSDEAKVPGTELSNYDEGHIIADSLGGVSNAYNITPENSYLNRFGAQSQLEELLRTSLKQGSVVSNVFVEITYKNNTTMIPYYYHFSFYIDGVYYESGFFNFSTHSV